MTASLRSVWWMVATVAAVTACAGAGGGAAEVGPTLTVNGPTSFTTNGTGVTLGGRISHASSVRGTNTTTGYSTWGYVTYSPDWVGTWFVEMPGLALGENVIVVTTDGTRPASVTVTVTRPREPARLILNGSSAASAQTFWTGPAPFGVAHKLALYADGTGQSTTGSAFAEPAGAVVPMRWSMTGPDVVEIAGCPSCAFQRISRISGSFDDGVFYGEIVTVGGVTQHVIDAFQLTAGSP